MGLQTVVNSWKQQTVIDSDDRQKILLLITDGRPKPRTTASDAEGDTAEPGCIETMVDTDLPICANGASPAPDVCRNAFCGDVDMSQTDCCPGDQNPCTSDQKDALLQELRDADILVAIIAVGKDAGNIKSAPKNCVPNGCTP